MVVDPVEPEVPVVSATANGTDSTAEPIPNATANAPTRPMTPAKVMSPTLQRAWISMDGTTFEACTSEPTPIDAITTLLD